MVQYVFLVPGIPGSFTITNLNGINPVIKAQSLFSHFYPCLLARGAALQGVLVAISPYEMGQPFKTLIHYQLTYVLFKSTEEPGCFQYGILSFGFLSAFFGIITMLSDGDGKSWTLIIRLHQLSLQMQTSTALYPGHQ